MVWNITDSAELCVDWCSFQTKQYDSHGCIGSLAISYRIKELRMTLIALVSQRAGFDGNEIRIGC